MLKLCAAGIPPLMGLIADLADSHLRGRENGVLRAALELVAALLGGPGPQASLGRGHIHWLVLGAAAAARSLADQTSCAAGLSCQAATLHSVACTHEQTTSGHHDAHCSGLLATQMSRAGVRLRSVQVLGEHSCQQPGVGSRIIRCTQRLTSHRMRTASAMFCSRWCLSAWGTAHLSWAKPVCFWTEDRAPQCLTHAPLSP